MEFPNFWTEKVMKWKKNERKKEPEHEWTNIDNKFEKEN